MVFLYTNIENSIQKKLDSCYNAVVGFKNHPALEKVKTLPDANARKTEELWALIEDRTIKKLHETKRHPFSLMQFYAIYYIFVEF